MFYFFLESNQITVFQICLKKNFLKHFLLDASSLPECLLEQSAAGGGPEASLYKAVSSSFSLDIFSGRVD